VKAVLNAPADLSPIEKLTLTTILLPAIMGPAFTAGMGIRLC
jgi:hypothetical protein